MSDLKKYDLTSEEWREYVGPGDRVYRIDKPIALYLRPGGTTHRVVDSAGITHCVEFPATGVTLRWKADPPVSF